ncbi:hypothetical protein AHAS_Ahas16G0201200 [Arachis hypogaea]
MEFNSSYDQTNFMGYYPPSPIYYSNGGQEYHQKITDSEHSNQWRYASEPQDEQDKFMGYYLPPQDDLDYYPHGDWEYQQGMREYEQSSEMNYFPKAQKPSLLEQTFNSFMQSCPTSPPCFSFENLSSLDYTSTQSFLQDPYNSFHQPQDTPDYSQNSFYIPQLTTIPTSPQNPPQSASLLLQAEQDLQSAIDSRERTRELFERQEQSWKEQETLFKKMDGHLEQMRRNL